MIIYDRKFLENINIIRCIHALFDDKGRIKNHDIDNQR